MTQPLFVDAGGWVAYFDKSDKDHVAVKDCLSRVVTGTAWFLRTSNYVIDETVTFLRYHTNHATACAALDSYRRAHSARYPCKQYPRQVRQRKEK